MWRSIYQGRSKDLTVFNFNKCKLAAMPKMLVQLSPAGRDGKFPGHVFQII
jgi:hypothetical protein